MGVYEVEISLELHFRECSARKLKLDIYVYYVRSYKIGQCTQNFNQLRIIKCAAHIGKIVFRRAKGLEALNRVGLISFQVFERSFNYFSCRRFMR